MKFTEFLRRQMSEADGTPSNNRVMLFLFLSTVMLLIIAVAFSPVVTGGAVKLPEIPPSLEAMIEWVTGILVGGGAIGKGMNALNAMAQKGGVDGTAGNN